MVNSYNENLDKWEEIDNNEIKILNTQEENENGVIYILKRINNPSQIPKEHERRDKLYSAVAASQRISQQNKNTEDQNIRKSNYWYMPKERQPRASSDQENERERKTIELKRNNVIIRGISEKNNENDIKTITDINKELGNHNFDKKNIKRTERIGDNFQKGRPLKVEFDTQLTKIQMMRKLYLLQDDERYKGISFQHDLTRSQMSEYRSLVEKSMEQEQNDTSGRFKYRVRGPPGRWEIMKIQKN